MFRYAFAPLMLGLAFLLSACDPDLNDDGDMPEKKAASQERSMATPELNAERPEGEGKRPRPDAKPS